jgi:hypothetical protein
MTLPDELDIETSATLYADDLSTTLSDEQTPGDE